LGHDTVTRNVRVHPGVSTHPWGELTVDDVDRSVVVPVSAPGGRGQASVLEASTSASMQPPDLRGWFDVAAVAMLIFDTTARVTCVNQACCALLQRRASELAGLAAADPVHPGGQGGIGDGATPRQRPRSRQARRPGAPPPAT
jgi:hypothetical protein